MYNYLKEKFSKATYKNIITKLLIAVIAASLIETAFSPYAFSSADYFNSISFGVYLSIVIVLFAISFLTVNEKYDGYITITLTTALFFLTNYQSKNIFFALVTALVVGGLVFYFSETLDFPSLPKKVIIFLGITLGALFVLFVGGLTIVKFLNHRTPNFDFGIFSQMYHYMSETLVPYTTCERDMLLSHFAVHFSPILYIALPVYWLFPNPSTILAVQAIAVALGLIPLYKLSKHFGLSNNKTLAIIAIYVLHPTVIANNFYYFHENCFLTVLLLWLFYFAETKNTVLTFVFATLTMMVKEDAPVYILFFGLYLLFANKSKIKGALLCVYSAVYFSIVTTLMSMYGQGIMTYRYDNFIFEDGGSIYSVIINVIKNPTYLFTQILNADKLEFLILMLVPLALLPFAIKKPSSLILLFPMLLINLMTEYVYQYDIGFQYTYATVAFLFYLIIINVKDLTPKLSKNLLICAVCASMIFFASQNLGRITAVETFKAEQSDVETINRALETIPHDKSVKSDTFLIPALWNRNEVYEYSYSDEKTDYVVFDLRWSSENHIEFLERESNSYTQTYFEDGLIVIYKAK